MPRGIYECVNCGHREVLDSTEPVLEGGACPKCGGDMILVGYAVGGGQRPQTSVLKNWAPLAQKRRKSVQKS